MSSLVRFGKVMVLTSVITILKPTQPMPESSNLRGSRNNRRQGGTGWKTVVVRLSSFVEEESRVKYGVVGLGASKESKLALRA